MPYSICHKVIPNFSCPYSYINCFISFRNNLGTFNGRMEYSTFKNARKLVETALSIPLDRMVIETDCPYMAPEPFRGRRNDPGYLYRVAERLAELRGVTPEEMQNITLENGKRLYRLN